MSFDHPLHIAVGLVLQEAARNASETSALLDPACGGSQHLPLFLSSEKSRRTRLCCVDGLILQRGRIKVVVEIEESGRKPTKVCGKFFSAALAAGFIHDSHGGNLIPMDESAVFVQVLDTDRIAFERTARFHQWEQVATAIKARLPIPGASIRHYDLFQGCVDDFAPAGARRSDLLRRLIEVLA